MNCSPKYFIKCIPFIPDSVPLQSVNSMRCIILSADEIKQSKKLFYALSLSDRNLINAALRLQNDNDSTHPEHSVRETPPCLLRNCWVIRSVLNYDRVVIHHLCDGECREISTKRLYRNKSLFFKLAKTDRAYIRRVLK